MGQFSTMIKKEAIIFITKISAIGWEKGNSQKKEKMDICESKALQRRVS